jgi:hypothetical protein
VSSRIERAAETKSSPTSISSTTQPSSFASRSAATAGTPPPLKIGR